MIRACGYVPATIVKLSTSFLSQCRGGQQRDCIILEWTTSLDTSSRTLFVREGGCQSGCPRHVERRVT